MYGIHSVRAAELGLTDAGTLQKGSDDKVATETRTTVAHNARGRVEAGPAPADCELAERADSGDQNATRKFGDVRREAYWYTVR